VNILKQKYARSGKSQKTTVIPESSESGELCEARRTSSYVCVCVCVSRKKKEQERENIKAL